MITIGLGTGGIKANVTPMTAEKYSNSQPVLKTLRSGETVVVDPELTVQFYWVVNVGALSPLITVNIEAHNSFWLAYLIPLIVIVLTLGIFLLGRNKYVKIESMGSAILDAVRTAKIAIKERGFNNVKPSILREHGRDGAYPIAIQECFTDEYVDDVRRGLNSCKAPEIISGPFDFFLRANQF
ncbi:unnamed protein product [Clonostachys chloroleuca]|uniref:Uncharacterized protein n=1 Tax=Clonostachys chloroleuca TaxID=1926264 RepID=A0AA35Q743_9HYPO|nr:unnamed protein product [Clonostachys chloroleuca]